MEMVKKMYTTQEGQSFIMVKSAVETAAFEFAAIKVVGGLKWAAAGIFMRVQAQQAMRELVAMAEVQAASRGLAYEITSVEINEVALLQELSAPYKDMTRLGHAISKHAQRHPAIWGKLSGPKSGYHNLALKHFEDIMRAPGHFLPVRSGDQRIHFLEKKLADGRGLRLNLDGSFKRFFD